MTTTDPTVDDLAQLCFKLATNEVCEIFKEVKPRDLTGVEIVALLALLRPVRERLKQPAPVLQLVRSGKRQRR